MKRDQLLDEIKPFVLGWVGGGTGGGGTASYSAFVGLEDDSSIDVDPDGSYRIKIAGGDGLTSTAGANTVTLDVDLAAPSGLSFNGGQLQVDDSIAGAGLSIAGKVLSVDAGAGGSAPDDAQYLTLALDADLSAERRFVDGDGLTGTDGGADGDYTLALTTPGTLSVSSGNAAAGNHTHAITTSSNPGAAASILASDASGYLQLTKLGVGSAPTEVLTVNGLIKISTATAVDNDSPGLVNVSDADFLYDGDYLNHYGLGWYNYSGDVFPGRNAYLSSYYGIDFFTGGTNRLRISIYGNVGIGAVDPAGKVHIKGTSDDQQLIIQANATQTANILEIQNSASTVLLGIDGSGDLETGNFASQTTGWQATYAGAADFRSIYADEMHVKSFIAEIYSALAGALIITKSRGRLSRDFTIPIGRDIVDIDGDVSGAAIVTANVASDYFEIAGDEASKISIGDKFTVAGSTGNDGVWEVLTASWQDPNTRIGVTGDITDATADGTITFHHYFTIAGDQTSKMPLGVHFIVNESSGNDANYYVASVSYDAGDNETDIYPTTAIPSFVGDGKLGRIGALYMEDLEGWEGIQIFDDGDFVRLRYIDTSGGGLIVTDAWGRVTGYADQGGGEQKYWFTGIDDGGVDGSEIYAGSVALDYGQQGSGSQGVWEATVLDTAGAPYSQVKTWATNPWTPGNWTVNVRLGNLDGISGIGLEYGLWAGDGTTTADSYMILSDNQVKFNNIPLTMYNATKRTILLDNDGDASFGKDIDTVADTVFRIFSNDQAYNAENFTSGDILIGDHANANILWDQSAGTLDFRGGTTTECYINTTGQFVAGASNVEIDKTGISLKDTDADTGRIRWFETLGAGTPTMTIGREGGSGLSYFEIAVDDSNDVAGTLSLSVTAGADVTKWYMGAGTSDLIWGYLKGIHTYSLTSSGITHIGNTSTHTADLIMGVSDSVRGSLSLYGFETGHDDGAVIALYMSADHDATYNEYMVMVYEDDLRFYSNGGAAPNNYQLQLDPTGDLSVAGGLFVGNTTVPDDNDIHFMGNLKSNKGATDHDVYAMKGISATDLYDNQGTPVQWAGGQAVNAGTYVFNADANGNSWPTDAQRVLVLVQAQFSNAGDNILGRYQGGSTTEGMQRCQNTSIPVNEQWIIDCDGNGDFEIVLSANATNCLCRMLGYWI